MNGDNALSDQDAMWNYYQDDGPNPREQLLAVAVSELPTHFYPRPLQLPEPEAEVLRVPFAQPNVNILPLAPTVIPLASLPNAEFSVQADWSSQQLPTTSTTSFSTMASLPSVEEFADLQRLSTDYKPCVEGPLVSVRQTTEALSAEYANADPVFVQKTAALSRKYSHYRTVKGDGNCGWRALAFTYFETLRRTGDRNRILGEEARMLSLNNLLKTVGFEEHVYEDFVEETIDLLRFIASSLFTEFDDAALLAKFNDVNVSNAVITHFRLLTSAWMKTHVDDYSGFILDGTVHQYCSTNVEPYQVEIEHIGMNALIDVVVKPANLAVEILYLDRSEGSEVNSHKFETLGPNGFPLYSNTPTMRLLYRPGHYDILYEPDDLLQIPISIVSTYTSPDGIPYTPLPSTFGDVGLLSTIPGVSGSDKPKRTTPRLSPKSGHRRSRISSTSSSSPPPTHPVSPVDLTHDGSGSITGRRGSVNFRPSKYELKCRVPSIVNSDGVDFVTPPFRDSEYNHANYRNRDFQPEIWSPGDEPMTPLKVVGGEYRWMRTEGL
ncbi:MAG: hypothetical protein M1825_004799 [Sarcosagium campestre]|nr:MAG: hypothetical protein M1825_004799 [Sarcosagium campestre]